MENNMLKDVKAVHNDERCFFFFGEHCNFAVHSKMVTCSKVNSLGLPYQHFNSLEKVGGVTKL
jgi:hypothetical protein